jgi:hypothetical protein
LVRFEKVRLGNNKELTGPNAKTNLIGIKRKKC